MVRMEDGKIMKRQCHLSLKSPLCMPDKCNHLNCECEKEHISLRQPLLFLQIDKLDVAYQFCEISMCYVTFGCLGPQVSSQEKEEALEYSRLLK